jgi:hypothetical protein
VEGTPREEKRERDVVVTDQVLFELRKKAEAVNND